MSGSKIPTSLRVVSLSAMGLALSSHATPGAAQTAEAPAQLPTIGVEADRPREREYRVEKPSSWKYVEPLRDTPQTINIIPEAVIKDRGATSLRETLRSVPGVALVAGEGGGPQGDNLRIRGFAANTDIFVDGVRDIAQYNRDPFNLEQVEVVKGPASVFAGRGSTGGTVNLVSKIAQPNPFAAADATLGTDGTRRVTADWNAPLAEAGLPTSALRVNFVGHESGIAGRDEVEYERVGIAPSFSWGLGTPTRATLNYLHLSEDNIPDYGLPLVSGRPAPGTDRDNFYGFRSVNTENTSTDMGTLQVEHDFSDWLSVRSLARYEENDRLAIICAPRNTPPSLVVTCGPFTGRDSANSLAINQTDATARFQTGPLDHALVGGFEVARESFRNQALSFAFPPGSPSFDLNNPDPDAPFTGVRSNGTRTRSTGDTLAFYAFDTIKIGAQWQVVGGVRWDRYDAESRSTPAGGPTDRTSRTDEFTSWRAAVLYKPVPEGTLYASAGTSFNPSAEAGSLSSAATSTSSSLLPPEKNLSYEVGAKWEVLDRKLLLTAALFRTEKENARTRELTTDAYVLDGDQRVQGVELGVAGNITDRWRVTGGYTYLDSKVLSSLNPAEEGNEVSRTPPHTFTLWTTYDVTDDWQLGAGVQYVSSQNISSTNDDRLKGYWVFDALAAYRIDDHYSLRLNMLNITDEYYIERAHGGGGHGLPGPGITGLLTLASRY